MVYEDSMKSEERTVIANGINFENKRVQTKLSASETLPVWFEAMQKAEQHYVQDAT